MQPIQSSMTIALSNLLGNVSLSASFAHPISDDENFRVEDVLRIRLYVLKPRKVAFNQSKNGSPKEVTTRRFSEPSAS